MTGKRTKKQQEQVDWLWVQVSKLGEVQAATRRRKKRYPKLADAVDHAAHVLCKEFVRIATLTHDPELKRK